MRRMLSIVVCLIILGGCQLFPTRDNASLRLQDPESQLVFHCDFPLPADHRLIREVTEERDDVYQLLDLTPSTRPIHVHLFRDEAKYRKFVASRFPEVPERRAFFLESDTQLAVYAVWSDRVSDDLRHEVAHGYLHSVVPNLPLWLDEGLAEYFEVPRGRRGLNVPHVELLISKIESGWQPDLTKLEALASAGEMQQHHYAEAWAWIHFLLETEPERRELLCSYLDTLRQEGKVEPLSERLQPMFYRPEAALVEHLWALHREL